MRDYFVWGLNWLKSGVINNASKRDLEISWTLSPTAVKIENIKYSDPPHIKLLPYVSCSTTSFLYFISKLLITLWDSGWYYYYHFKDEDISICHMHSRCQNQNLNPGQLHPKGQAISSPLSAYLIYSGKSYCWCSVISLIL